MMNYVVVFLLSTFGIFPVMAANPKFCGNLLQYHPDNFKYKNGAPGVMCLYGLPGNRVATYVEVSNEHGNFRAFGYGYNSPNSSSNQLSFALAEIRNNPNDGGVIAGVTSGFGNLLRWTTNNPDELFSSFVLENGGSVIGLWNRTSPSSMGFDYVTDKLKHYPQSSPFISMVNGQWVLGKCNTNHPKVRVYTTILPDRLVKRCVLEENRKVLAWIAFGHVQNKPFVELGGGNEQDVFGNRGYRAGKICVQQGLECNEVSSIQNIQFFTEPNGQEKYTVTYVNGSREDWLYNIDI